MPDISPMSNSGGAEALNPAATLKSRSKQPVDRRGVPLPIRKSGYDALDKNSFLKLLVTQLSKQDPTNPMNDREFISQMAQFSSLEQMNNVANSMNKLRGSQANGLIGKMVQGKDFVTDKPIQGIVTSSIFSPNGDVLLKVNGRHIKLDDISEVTEVTPIAAPPQVPVAMPSAPNVSRETIPPRAAEAAQAAKAYEINQKAAEKLPQPTPALPTSVATETPDASSMQKNKLEVPKGE